MNDLLIQRRMQMPVVTGVPANLESVHGSEVQAGSSFQEVLAQAANKTAEISFTKHAAGRVAERGIELSSRVFTNIDGTVIL